MYGAAKIYQDFNHRYPPSVEQYGLFLVSESKQECIDYIHAHRQQFLEMHGYCYPALIEFDPAKCPESMRHYREDPDFHIAAYGEREYLASNAKYVE